MSCVVFIFEVESNQRVELRLTVVCVPLQITEGFVDLEAGLRDDSCFGVLPFADNLSMA